MKTFEEYNKEVRKNIIDLWKKNGRNVQNIENDPVINLMLTAFAYQAYHIHTDIQQFEEHTFRTLRDRIIPYHLVKPVPAFSIIEAGLKPECEEKLVDENCTFEFVNHRKQKFTFTPLINTKILNAELAILDQPEENVYTVELSSEALIENLSGISFYLNSQEPLEIVSIKYDGQELPLIHPTQFNELPFTNWFNNAHLLLDQNYYLFGTYNYWQEIFLAQKAKLYYIGQCGKELSFFRENNIVLEITFNEVASSCETLKINCFPVVNVEKKDVLLEERNPVKDLTYESGEFLNLLYLDNDEKEFENIIIRQHDVERYNSNQLFTQVEELMYRYQSDYYAFQNIRELSVTDKLDHLKDIMDDIRGIVNKAEEKMLKDHFYAILKKNENPTEKIALKYLTTGGDAANGIKENSIPSKAPIVFDTNNTTLLIETQGGRNSIRDDAQKDDIAKYYFQTKDRLVTPADITTYIRTYYYKEQPLDKEIDNISFNRDNEGIRIVIFLKKDSPLKNSSENESLSQILKTKIELRSSGILPFFITIS